MERYFSTTRIYVGNIPLGTKRNDIKNIFEMIGKVRSVSHVFGCHYAFVEFVDPEKAPDAVTMDGHYYNGNYLKVQFSQGPRSRGGQVGNATRQYGVPFFCRDRNAVLVTGLPVGAKWQDLKDHMRRAGDVSYATVYKDGSGVAEFRRRRDMHYAAKRLNLSKLTTREGERAYIRVFKAGESIRQGSSSERTRSRSCSPKARDSRRSDKRSPKITRHPKSSHSASNHNGPKSSHSASYHRSPKSSPSDTSYHRGHRSRSPVPYRRAPRSPSLAPYRRAPPSPSPAPYRCAPRSPSPDFYHYG